MSNRRKLRPTPGLRGDYQGTCIACLLPADTGFAVRGEAEWIIVALMRLNLTTEEALAVLAEADPRFRGGVPVGRQTVYVRLCATCAERFEFPTPGLILPDHPLPGIIQPGEVSDE